MVSQAIKRRNYTAIIFFLYLGAISLLSLFSMGIFTPERSWPIFGFGLFLASFGALCCHLILKKWEDETSKHLKSLSHIQQKTEHAPFSPCEDSETLSKISKIEEEFALYQTQAQEEIDRKSVLLSEYQKTINEQRSVIEKKQLQISEFEEKIKDLNYDLNTLLELTEMDKPLQKTTPNNQFKQPEETPVHILHNAISAAEKIAGSTPFGQDLPRYRELPLQNNTLDLRRLFDTLQGETTSSLFVFSQKERRLLFVNHHITKLLGWSSEHFINHLPDIIEEGIREFSEALRTISGEKEIFLPLVMRKNTGGSTLIHCTLGVIPTGIFRSHIIGVLTQA